MRTIVILAATAVLLAACARTPLPAARTATADTATVLAARDQRIALLSAAATLTAVAQPQATATPEITYSYEAQGIITSVSAALADVSRLTNAPDLASQSWRNQMSDNTSILRMAPDSWRNINLPMSPTEATLHARIQVALDVLATAADDIDAGIRDVSASELSAGTSAIQTATALLP
ncbi:MAG: hypothetical protein ACYC9X_14455 [Dehalococcoidia bacterium]